MAFPLGISAREATQRNDVQAVEADVAEVQVHNPPGAEVGPGQIATWGRATANRVDDFGFKWEWDGRSSKHFPFDWSGPGE
jgi:hypothetical protein